MADTSLKAIVTALIQVTYWFVLSQSKELGLVKDPFLQSTARYLQACLSFLVLEAAYLISYEELVINSECDWVVRAKPPQWSVDGGSIFLPFLCVFLYQRNYEVMVLGYVESGDV